MEVVKANLDGTTSQPQVDPNAVYLVDFSKMQRIEDLISVLAAVGFSFSPQHPQFVNIQHLLDLSRPIQINNPQQTSAAQEREIKLPKLKKLD
jgi:hypothetical protein